MEKVFDSDDFPPREALAAWAAITWDAVMPTSFGLVGTDTFRGQFRALQLGPANATAMTYRSLRSTRTPKLIRMSDPECVQAVLARSGRHVLEQNRTYLALRPDDIAFFDSSRPFDSWADGEALLLQVPRALLPVPEAHLDRMLCRRLRGDSGAGRLLAGFLTHLAEDGTCYGPHDGPRLGAVAVDLVSAVLAHHMDDNSTVPAGSRQKTLFLRVTTFIQARLGDADTNAETVAAAHHVSVRSLHRLFQQNGVSVRAWIRDQRLERCRRDLIDPMNSHVPIGAIASRWGFPRHADFTRAFRARYGITPRDFRELAHRRAPESGTPR